MKKFPKMSLSNQYYDQDYYFFEEYEGFKDEEYFQKLVIYHPNGTLSNVDFFKNGKRHGKMFFYNEKGEIYRWEKYQNGFMVKKSDGLSPFQGILQLFQNNKNLDLKKLSKIVKKVQKKYELDLKNFQRTF